MAKAFDDDDFGKIWAIVGDLFGYEVEGLEEQTEQIMWHYP